MYQFLDSPELRKEKRLIWAATRSVLENVNFTHKRSGKKSKSHWNLFLRLLKIFAFLLKITGYYHKGYSNAKTIRVNELNLRFTNLPASFNGFKFCIYPIFISTVFRALLQLSSTKSKTLNSIFAYSPAIIVGIIPEALVRF